VRGAPVPGVARRLSTLAVAAALAVAGATTWAAVAAAAPSPVGAHSMLQLNDPVAFMQAMFAQAAGMHASSIRLDIAPSLVFSSPGAQPDFSGLDEVMALAQQYDLQVVGDLYTIPWWISDCQSPTNLSGMTICGTNDLGEYGSMISQIVAHADPVIRYWEIWNEPDDSQYFTGTPQQYAQMLRTAHDAIKAIDSRASVLLGGMSSTAAMNWLTQVFAAPGADAAGAFDIANIHERGWLDGLAGDVAAWSRFLAGYGFNGPLWVTEHGYPSDPAYQYDPSFALGQPSQAAFLTASIPTLIDAGASEVFVAERDNLSGQFASEGVLGGDVSDPPVADPQVIEKPAYAAVAMLAQCYANIGRDCPGPAPVVTPSSLTLPRARLGSTSGAAVTVRDPGQEPLQLGQVTLAGAAPDPVSVQSDGCSNQILEPNETCAVALRFAPAAGGAAAATLEIPSDNGTVGVPVVAVSPSVSSLGATESAFVPIAGGDGIGHRQRLVLRLSNPLTAAVQIGKATVTGADPRRFTIQSNSCAHTDLAPRASCGVAVLFTPGWAGDASAVLTLSGDGTPLLIPLRATAFALSAVTSVTFTGCMRPGPHDEIQVLTSQQSTLGWRLAPAHTVRGPRCNTTSGAGAGSRSAAIGHVQTSRRPRPRHYVARISLPLAGRRGLRPGTYLLTITPANVHGAGRPRTTLLTIAA
jgi:hypothetical protein